MIWSGAHAIEIIFKYTTLESSDNITLGITPGVGHARIPKPHWLEPGEIVEIEIWKIGNCSRPVIGEADW